tara:strand:+ start:2168 stop:2320 length:153 start_codon:yes stop_codon:yes gene_type:complete
MGISRGIKDFIFFLPYLFALGISVISITLIYLSLSFGAFLIFIYEQLKWK